MDHSQPPETRIASISPGSSSAPLAEPSSAGPTSDRRSDPGPAGERVTGISDEIELGTRLRSRDPAALAELYRAHRRQAFGLAYRVLGDGAAAEDAVHAAFLALWEQADRLDPHGGRLGSLVMTIVHRRAVDLARRRARDERRSAPAGHQRSEDDDGDRLATIPDEAAIEIFEALLDDGVDIRRRLTHALDSLPAEQRQVIEHAYFEGLTHQAIAERLGLPPGTVKSRIRLGVHRLRDELGITAGRHGRGTR